MNPTCLNHRRIPTLFSYTGMILHEKVVISTEMEKNLKYEASFMVNFRKLFAEKHLVYAGLNAELDETTGRSYAFGVEGFLTNH